MLLVYTDESQMEKATEEMLTLVAEGHRAVQEEARRPVLLHSTACAEGVGSVEIRPMRFQ